jgi:hypothetical protein
MMHGEIAATYIFAIIVGLITTAGMFMIASFVGFEDFSVGLLTGFTGGTVMEYMRAWSERQLRDRRK